MNELSCQNDFIQLDEQIRKNANRIQAVLILNAVVMVLEIYFGIISGSMALLADGWHMATHAAALGISLLTYKIATSEKITQQFNFGGGKIIALGGFTSALFLLAVAGYVIIESFFRFIRPHDIEFQDAIVVALLGLIVNFVGAYWLRPRREDHGKDQVKPHMGHHHSHSHAHHHSHGGHSDVNIKAAYLHIVADALTSVAAIAALIAGYFWGWFWLDALVGVVSSLVIFKWAYSLIRETGWELLDGHASGLDFKALKAAIENEGVKILDLHVWRIGPGVMTAELVISAKSGTNDTAANISKFRQILEGQFRISHSVIEVR